MEYRYLACVGHAEEPTLLPLRVRTAGQLIDTIGHGLGQKMLIILGSNKCAGSLPELGVIVNDRQWVISEVPQLGQTLPQVCGVGRLVL